MQDADSSPRAAGGPGVTAAAEAAQVTAFWRDLGLPGLVDIHTHFMPDNVLAKVWAYFEDGRAGKAWPIAYRQPEAERIALLCAFGVRAFSALLYPHKPGMASWLNAWAADFAARTPDALHSATFFPESGAADYVASAIGAGARLFKAHVQVGSYDPTDEQLDPVWGLLAEAGMPVVVRCGSAFPPELLPRLAAAADRILLGSDFPNIPYPYLHQLHALARLNLGSEWLRAVCHDNAVALLGL